MLNHSPLTGIILGEAGRVIGERGSHFHRHSARVFFGPIATLLQFDNQLCHSQRLAFEQDTLSSRREPQNSQRRSCLLALNLAVTVASAIERPFVVSLQAIDLAKCLAVVLEHCRKCVVSLRSGLLLKNFVDIHAANLSALRLASNRIFQKRALTGQYPILA
jgi:hypothetical protein